MLHVRLRRFSWLATCCLLVCSVDAQIQVVCPAGQYDPSAGSGPCVLCPIGSTSVAGSTAISSCQCNAGWTGENGGTCMQCGSNTYKMGLGFGICADCPSFSTSPVASITNTNCKCNAGYMGADGADCSQCSAGKYRPFNFNQNWARSCGNQRNQPCTAHMQNLCCSGNPARALDDNLNGGKNHGSCVESGSGSLSWFSVDIHRPVNITGLTVYGRTDCCWSSMAGYSIYAGNDLSNAGMFTNNALCVAPVPGLFIAPSGPARLVCQEPISAQKLIVSVPNGFTMCEFQISSSDCAECPLNSISAIGSAALGACECDAGFTGPNGGICLPCVAGTFKTAAGSQACSFCPTGSTSAVGSISVIACFCSAGFTGIGFTCLACGVDTFKVASGPGECANCLVNSQSPSPGVPRDRCLCSAGFTGPDSGTCAPCVAGQFKSAIGSAVCLTCPIPTFSLKQGSDSIANCTSCKAGFTGNSDAQCTACAPGTSKADDGDSMCIPYTCPANQFTSESTGRVLQICHDCPLNTISLPTSTEPSQCQCRADTYVETHMLNPPYAQRSYSSIAGNDHINSRLDDLLWAAAWAASTATVGQFMEIDTLAPMQIVGIITQGRGPTTHQSWIREFRVEYRLDNTIGSTVSMPGSFTMISPSKVQHIFAPPVYARYIRIIVLRWNSGSIGMRAALIVNSCSSCFANSMSQQDSVALAACECPAGLFRYSSNINVRALALVPGRAQLSTLANRGLRDYAATAQFSSSAGPAGAKGAVAFNRPVFEYLDGGSHQFNIGTNGFTAVAVARFTSSGNNERVFDFGNNGNNDNLMLGRNGNTNNLIWAVRNGIADCLISANNALVLNTWLTIVATYNHNSNTMQLRVGNINAAPVVCSTPRVDRFVTITFVGKDIGHVNYLSGSIAGLYTVDALLTVGEIATVVAQINAGEDTLLTCTDCGPGNYVSNEACHECPVGSSSLEGNTSINNCICIAGFTGPDGGPCPMCVAGRFKNVTGSGACSLCPGNATSMAGSTVIVSCKCNPGFTGVDGGACAECGLNTFKSVIGPAQCANCPTNSQSPVQGVSRSHCLCDVGFTGPDSGTCAPCVDGQFKSLTGSAACSICPVGSNSLQIAATNINTCICNAGFTGSYVGGDTCTTCLPGKYKAAVGSAICSDCPSNSTSKSGSINVDDCNCNRGYLKTSEGTCAPCAAGKFQDDSFVGLLRRERPFIVSRAVDWNTATQRFVSSCGTSTCIGNTGGRESGVVSTGVQTGHGAFGQVPFVSGTTSTRMQWGAGSVPAAFTICSVTRYSGSARARILNCMSNPAGNMNWLHGHWNGFAGSNHYNGDHHQNLQFSIPIKTDWVVMCGLNIANTGRSGIIVNNIVKATGRGGSGNCALGIGHSEVSDWQLSELYIWNYHLSTADFALAASLLHNKLTTGVGMHDNVCEACPLNSYSEAGSSACYCNAGYTGGNAAVCAPCAAGTFKAATGSASCSICPALSSSLEGAIECGCPAGLTLNADGICASCGPGTYFLNGACELCPVGLTSLNGATSINDCICAAGSTGTNAGPCAQCVAGTFKNAPGSQPCSSCPDNATSDVGSTLITSCYCGSGYTASEGGACAQCSVNTFKLFAEPDQCANCPANSQSPAQGVVRDMCLCNTGFSGPDSGACTQCLVGTFKSVVGSAACSSCPMGLFLPIDGTSIDDCVCAAGYTGKDGANCTACAPGTSKAVTGDSACIPYSCPANQFSSEVAANTGTVCWPCPLNALSVAASSGSAACQCRAGTYEETLVLNPPYAQRTYSSMWANRDSQSLLHDFHRSRAWASATIDLHQWMEIDAGTAMHIVGIITQGRGGAHSTQWVREFKLEYRLDNAVGSSVVLSGMFSRASTLEQEHLFSTPIYARYIRIIATDWNSHISMRAALIVKSCSSCMSTATSLQGSMSEADCMCPGRSYKFSSAADQRAIALVPGRSQLSTLAHRGLRNHSATAQFRGSAGPAGTKGALTFDRTTSQYLDAGSHQFDIDINGFTAVVAVRFTSTGPWERVFDMGSGMDNDNIIIARVGTTADLQFSIRNGGLECWLRSTSGPAVLDTWLTIVAKYDHNSMKLSMQIGNTFVTPVVCDTPRINRNVVNTFVGKSNWADPYFSGSIAGLYVVDALLTKSEIVNIVSRINAGEDVLQTCAPCPIGIFESGPGIALSACQTCPPTSLLLENICMPCPLNTVPVPDQQRCVSSQHNFSVNIINVTDDYPAMFRSANKVATVLLIATTARQQLHTTLVINAATREQTMWQHIANQTVRSCQDILAIIAAIPSIEDQYLQTVRLLKINGPCAPGLTGYDLLQDPGDADFMDSECVLLATTTEDTRRDALLVVQRRYMGRDAKDQYKIYDYSAQYLTPALVRHAFGSDTPHGAHVSFCNVRDREHSPVAFDTALSRVWLWTVPQSFVAVTVDGAAHLRQSIACT